MVLQYIIAATVLVSLISLVGIVLLFMGKSQREWLLFFLVSFAGGTLLGAAFFDMLPESIGASGAVAAMEYCLAGLLVAFAIEKVVHWHHHHAGSEREHKKPLGMLTLVGDGVHNFFDGVAIAASFMVGVPLGITTTVAIIFHEIPQEIGDFTLLLYSGYSKMQGLAFNFISALTAVAGGLVFYFFSSAAQQFEGYALAFSAGMFIYMATADILPQLHREKGARNSVAQLALLVLGAMLIWAVVRNLGG